MSGRRKTRGQKNNENKFERPAGCDETTKASSNIADQASPDGSPGMSMESADIIKAINELKTELKGDNNCLRQEFNHWGQEINGKLDNLVAEIQTVSDRVGEAESRIEQVEGWAEEATAALCSCLDQQRALQSKLTDLESRSRRNNIRIFGVAEGEEGENSVPEFIESLLRSKLPIPEELNLKIQRAHRSLAQKPPPDKPPRPIIINFQEFTTKELVLKEAWKKSQTGKIELNNRILYFDHDYAAEIAKKRKEYNGIKKALKAGGIRFQNPYTSMKIHWDTGVRTYSSAQEAWLELKRRGLTAGLPEPTEGESPLRARLRERLGSWQKAADQRKGGSDVAQTARDKLQSFQSECTGQRGGI